jgi:hypothetical protein
MTARRVSAFGKGTQWVIQDHTAGVLYTAFSYRGALYVNCSRGTLPPAEAIRGAHA